MSTHSAALCLVLVVLVIVFSATKKVTGANWTSEQEKEYRQFLKEFDAGANCARLFALRQKFRRPWNVTPQEKAANAKLQSVGCFSASANRRKQTSKDANFTVKEYKIYRAVIDTPMSVSERVTYSRVGKRYGVTPAKAKQIAERIQDILVKNNWLGSPESEIRHAKDWRGN